MTSRSATIFLLGDKQGTVQPLERLLRMVGYEVRAFLSSHDFLVGYDPTTPGCAVLDFAMPGLNGLQLQDTLAASGRQPPIVFIGRSADISSGVPAMKRGAVDFLTKPIDKHQLFAAIQCAIEMDRQMRETRTELRSISARLARLTPRELEVFQHVVGGRRNKQIAADLGTVEKTIKVHRSSIMKKMSASSLPELVRMAVRRERAGRGYAKELSAEYRNCMWQYAQICPFETATKPEIGSTPLA
jgi:FixJ family two-component response regulator